MPHGALQGGASDLVQSLSLFFFFVNKLKKTLIVNLPNWKKLQILAH